MPFEQQEMGRTDRSAGERRERHRIGTVRETHRRRAFDQPAQFTVMVTGSEAIPFATTTSELAPVSIVIGTSNEVETEVAPVATAGHEHLTTRQRKHEVPRIAVIIRQRPGDRERRAVELRS
jgi:hypothetical protein